MVRTIGEKEMDYVLIDAVPDVNQSARGFKITMTAGETLAFDDLCYLKSDGKLWKADANASSTMPGLFVALGAISADAEGDFLVNGYLRNDSWSMTPGSTLYASATAGGITQTAPSGTGDQVQIVGRAVTATVMEFRPSSTTLEVS